MHGLLTTILVTCWLVGTSDQLDQSPCPEVPPGVRRQCKPLAQCSMFYTVLPAGEFRKCTEASGALGVCCPDVVDVHARTLKLIDGSPEARGLPEVRELPTVAVQESSRAAHLDLHYMNEMENYLDTMKIGMQRNSMAWGHSVNMAPTPDASTEANKGLLVVATSRRLQDTMNLSPYDAGYGLQRYDVRDTPLKDTCLPPPICYPSKYRTYDGSCNNLKYPNWGRALTPLERILPPLYFDGIWSPKLDAYGKELPNVRMIRSLIATDENHPVVDVTHMAMQWGQFVDHDLTHVPVFTTANRSSIDCCTPDGGLLDVRLQHPHCFPIEIPQQDPFYGPRGVRCLNFVRSSVAPRSNCRLGYADQLNQLTHVMDASHIYGSSEETAFKLREFNGGRLKYSVINGAVYLPQDMNAKGCVGKDKGLPCFFSGESRLNQVMGLTALHVFLLREHNRIATILAGLNPHWDDERLFQESRNIVIAQIQHVTYNEFLPTILGKSLMESYGLAPQTTDYSATYNENVNPTITNEFAAAAYRMGHSMIQGAVLLIQENGARRVELLRNWYDNPHILREPGATDAIIRGLVTEWTQNNDEWVSADVTDYLFKSQKRDYGLDLVAFNIWRGRDHGLPGYNAYREICGLPRAKSFADLQDVISKAGIDKLARLYKTVDDVDLYIAGIMEYHVPGSMVGPTFGCIIADQFARLKEGDRFYYEHGGHPHSFTPPQLQEIRRTSLAAIICNNAEAIKNIQPLVFRSPSNANPRVSCDSPTIPRMNLGAWKE